AVPVEVAGLRHPSKTDLAWDAAPVYSGTVYDVIRGDLLPAPVGANETCFVSDLTAPLTSDTDVPDPATGFRYLVRERVPACGTGTYGASSSGAERTNAACP